jgi:prepilin peptidase CpaA
MTALAIMAGVVGLAATIDDLWRRQISNWIPGSALAGGMILQTVQHGWRGAGSALAGTAAGAGVFLVFYLLGGMGGGDVKLMAGFGALLGVQQLLQAALWTAGCGGVLALAVIATRAIRDLWTRCNRARAGEPAAGQADVARAGRADSIPYAPAIAAGVWLSLVAAT